jgi:hypothetical protein
MPITVTFERYLRHVLPTGLRSIRYYGFCHPSAKANRMRVQFHTGIAVQFGSTVPAPDAASSSSCPNCPRCGQRMQLILSIDPTYKKRGPPVRNVKIPRPSAFSRNPHAVQDA